MSLLMYKIDLYMVEGDVFGRFPLYKDTCGITPITQLYKSSLYSATPFSHCFRDQTSHI